MSGRYDGRLRVKWRINCVENNGSLQQYSDCLFVWCQATVSLHLVSYSNEFLWVVNSPMVVHDDMSALKFVLEIRLRLFMTTAEAVSNFLDKLYHEARNEISIRENEILWKIVWLARYLTAPSVVKHP